MNTLELLSKYQLQWNKKDSWCLDYWNRKGGMIWILELSLPQSTFWNKFDSSLCSLNLTLFISKSKELGLKFWGEKKKRHTNLKTHFCSKPSDITTYNYDLEHVICFSETHVCSSVKWRSHTYSLFQVVERIKSYIPHSPPIPNMNLNEEKNDSFCLFICLCVSFCL